jgi:hypothetical protein
MAKDAFQKRYSAFFKKKKRSKKTGTVKTHSEESEMRS